MQLIKIVNGTYGHKTLGSKHIDPKDVGSPPFEVDDIEAIRLVDIGVAIYCLDIDVIEEAATPVATPDKEENVTGTGKNTPDGNAGEKPFYSSEMKADELKELMKKYGLSFKVGMTKDDIVAALDEFFDNEEEKTDDDVIDDEDPPSLSAENPVL
ncbi:MAG: hypothetical protein K0R50_400 [Eubacterium sp.]|jgi:hypothetical protein|nr:hypothetical protein [Eubacterium sp.]